MDTSPQCYRHIILLACLEIIFTACALIIPRQIVQTGGRLNSFTGHLPFRQRKHQTYSCWAPGADSILLLMLEWNIVLSQLFAETYRRHWCWLEVVKSTGQLLLIVVCVWLPMLVVSAGVDTAFKCLFVSFCLCCKRKRLELSTPSQ